VSYPLGPPRATAVDLLVPEADALVGEWYRQTDAFAKGMPPHVTLLYPWRPAPVAVVDLLELQSVLANVRPFDLALDRVGRFPGVLYLAPTEDQAVRALIGLLAAAFPDTPPYAGAFSNPVPHLTVCKSDDERALDSIERQLDGIVTTQPPLTVVVDEVCVDEEGPDGRWATRHRFRL